MEKDINLRFISTVLLLGIITAVLVYTVFSFDKFETNNADKQVANIEQVINKTLVQCYALEGAYPADLRYLADNYGIVLDEDNYIYHYEVMGSNIKPMLMVIPF